MQDIGNYFGATLLKGKELLENSNKNKIKLEYYSTEKRNIESEIIYGVSIVKKEYGKQKVKFEKNSVERITTNENKIEKIIETLKNFKVTPVGLNDVLTEILKRPEFQGE